MSAFRLHAVSIRAFFWLAALCAMLTGAHAIDLPERMSAASGEDIVLPVSQDLRTGFAISGFDPVSYFTGRRPRLGVAGNEVRWRGAAWRFANSGNRDAFHAHPEIYEPQFGGFGVVSLARGYLVDSDPEVYIIREGTLYLFFSRQQVAVFQRAPDEIIAQARSNWRRMNGMTEPDKPAERADKRVPDGPAVEIF